MMLGGDDPQHQARMGETAYVRVRDVVEDAVVQDALDEHLVDAAEELPAPGGQAADQFAHPRRLRLRRAWRPGRPVSG